jgi:hypothetical protein
MASLSPKERAQQYLERLAKAPNPRAELNKIFADLDSLVFTISKKPIDRETKLNILEELEQLIKLTPSLESLNEFRTYDSVHKSTQASDNSDILEVISAMKKRVQ